jgi:hypothetical protein
VARVSTTDGAEGSKSRPAELADFSDWDALPGRIAGVVEQARGVTLTDKIAASFAAIEDEPASAPGLIGRYGDARWRGLVGATFVADLACYAEPADQVSFDRLVEAMRVFPRGFRVWGARTCGAGWLPLGYTGVIPIAAATFERFEQGAASLGGPAITALPAVPPGGSFLYLFNFSVVPGLRGTPLAARVIKAFAEDVRRMPHRGLAALTVSRDGERVAARFGMAARGRVGAGAAHETVFACRVG